MDQTDIQKIAEIFDSIISSPSPAVQGAFKNLTVLATLCRNEEDVGKGPFSQIMGRLAYLEHELKQLRVEVQVQNNASFINDVQMDLNMDYNIPYVGNVGDISIGSISIDSSGAASNWVISDTSTITFK